MAAVDRLKQVKDTIIVFVSFSKSINVESEVILLQKSKPSYGYGSVGSLTPDIQRLPD